MTVFIDTSVIMYAGGAAHSYREPCQELMKQIGNGSLDAATSTEVIQEILHRFSSGRREVGSRMAKATLDLFERILPVNRLIMADAIREFEATPSLSARDVIHASTCAANSIRQIISVDLGFDRVASLTRIDPREWVTSP